MLVPEMRYELACRRPTGDQTQGGRVPSRELSRALRHARSIPYKNEDTSRGIRANATNLRRFVPGFAVGF